MPVIPPGMVFDSNGVEILSLYLPMLIDNGGNVVACLGEFSDLIKACREKIAQKNSNGKRPRRGVHGSEGGGFWKTSTGDKSVMDDHGRVLGFLNMLNFYEYHGNNNNYKKKNREEEFKKTNWIMYEYRLNRDNFQEWVICKIKNTGRKRDAPNATMDNDDGGLLAWCKK
ncbi:hypothetical protein V6N11_019384 [Hibiscus sabdariffa]|uniref:NAC domain-containing protein n=1 Tax=Hibiscus sabdariffa TaxID=183260 RepID=A0ABR2R2S5_9ROSI